MLGALTMRSRGLQSGLHRVAFALLGALARAHRVSRIFGVTRVTHLCFLRKASVEGHVKMGIDG